MLERILHFFMWGEIIKVEENCYSIKKDAEIASECEEIILPPILNKLKPYSSMWKLIAIGMYACTIKGNRFGI
ncbi:MULTISPECIES: hypothetical protein [Bacillus]|uniref:hypothetical protein n=1 Tax=Bacillus TaxID=1386 RepID=UPI00053947E3|nr:MULTISPECIES: hypothetical protein [Bacillus]MCU4822216.1 hypothetical protein [Bacillus cereus]ANP81180.1 hypothetical protein BAQ53_10000 [Bacillus sp. B25(2016b)]MCU4846645.1 hypothetical protein [Bacillus cereus]MCU4855153.1 hypothetical protein [Bacillus cereus]MCU4871899.1 hypothetical protein [Bacillus cereus]